MSKQSDCMDVRVMTAVKVLQDASSVKLSKDGSSTSDRQGPLTGRCDRDRDVKVPSHSSQLQLLLLRSCCPSCRPRSLSLLALAQSPLGHDHDAGAEEPHY